MTILRLACFLMALLSGGVFILFFHDIGTTKDVYKGVTVYGNGLYESLTHGKHISESGYFYGLKWQCVEFTRRFYKNVKNHEMPETKGDAKDYFDPCLEDGQLNRARGLHQYKNGSSVKPAIDDLIVFQDTHYGHIAVITTVGDHFIEVIQQNISSKTRQTFTLEKRLDQWFVTEPREAAGWLRLPAGPMAGE